MTKRPTNGRRSDLAYDPQAAEIKAAMKPLPVETKAIERNKSPLFKMTGRFLFPSQYSMREGRSH